MRQQLSTNHGHLQAMQYHKKWKHNKFTKICVKNTEYQNTYFDVVVIFPSFMTLDGLKMIMFGSNISPY
jgi:hypothetical protein